MLDSVCVHVNDWDQMTNDQMINRLP